MDGGTTHVASFSQSRGSAELARQIGTAACLMLRCKNYRFFATACLGVWIEPAIVLRQIRFFFDNVGEPIGYMTWALLAPDVEKRITTDPRFLLHDSEWNEGERLWIIDFVAPGGMAKEVLRYAEQDMFKAFSEAHYVRRNSDGSVKKVRLWRRRNAKTA